MHHSLKRLHYIEPLVLTSFATQEKLWERVTLVVPVQGRARFCCILFGQGLYSPLFAVGCSWVVRMVVLLLIVLFEGLSREVKVTLLDPQAAVPMG